MEIRQAGPAWNREPGTPRRLEAMATEPRDAFVGSVRGEVSSPPPRGVPAPATPVCGSPPATLAQLEAPSPGPLLEGGPPAPEAVALAMGMVVGRDLPDRVRLQAVREVAALPLPWVRRLATENLAVAVVRDGQSLADTDLLPEMTPERCRRHFPEARRIAQDTVDEQTRRLEGLLRQEGADEGRAAMDRYWLPEQIREALLPRFDQAGIGFSVEVAREAVDLERLANSKNIPPEDREAWTGLLAELNQGLATVDGATARAGHGILLVPYVHHRGRAVSEVSRDSFGQFDSMAMRNHRGIHSWPNRLLAVHEAYVRDPAEEVGHYRVLCHELGHALDYAAESLPEFGDAHRREVARLYRADREALARGECRFLTERAMDDEREYFAEAVEAWMTRPVADEQDFYKPGNSREELRRRNPDLFAYLSRLLAS